MAIVVAFSGKSLSGKSSGANILVRDFGFRELAFAEPLKRGVQAMFNLTDDQVYGDGKDVVDERWGVTPGQLLQNVGTDLMKNRLGEIFPDQFGNGAQSVWVRNMASQLDALGDDERVVITDLRFPDEFAFNCSRRILNVRVNCEDELRAARASALNRTLRPSTHASETALDVLPEGKHWFLRVDNNGTRQTFEATIRNFAHVITS